MNEPAIQAERLSKRYRLGAAPTLRQRVASWLGPRGGDTDNDFWALRDVSFEIQRGDVVGVIGRNGAGKSTLLKVLSRITDPTSGQATIRGRVGSLLEVGTGFHPELSGRENIFLNGAILGMRRREIRANFDAIVDFAGIDRFIDTPVKRYSSGMYVRLAFAVAAHLEPEILIVDEVLAVGDAGFQAKCLGKMSEVASNGRTVLFVSHNMAAIQNMCRRCLLLHGGELVADGEPDAVIRRYMDQVDTMQRDCSLAERRDRAGNGAMRITGFHLQSADGQPTAAAHSGDDCVFCFDYEAADDAARGGSVSMAFAVFDAWGRPLFRNATDVTAQDFTDVPDRGTFRCHVPRLPLVAGDYTVGMLLTVNGEIADRLDKAVRFRVEDGDFFATGKVDRHSPFLVDNQWRLAA